MKLRDLITDYIKDYEGLKPQEKLNYWTTYNDREIVERCIDDYMRTGIDYRKYAMENIFGHKKQKIERMLYVTNTIKKHIGEVIDKIREAFGLYLDDFQVIIYHGLGNSAGEATKIKGKPTILFGVEKVVSLGWDNEEKILNLIVHEYAHLIHESLQKSGLEREDPIESDVFRIYVEGFATYMEDVYHGRENTDWYQKCEERKEDLKSECLNRFKRGISCRDFYGDWWEVFGISDTGYYLGYQFIKYLLKEYGLVEIASFEYNEVQEKLYYFLRFKPGR